MCHTYDRVLKWNVVCFGWLVVMFFVIWLLYGEVMTMKTCEKKSVSFLLLYATEQMRKKCYRTWSTIKWQSVGDDDDTYHHMTHFFVVCLLLFTECYTIWFVVCRCLFDAWFVCLLMITHAGMPNFWESERRDVVGFDEVFFKRVSTKSDERRESRVGIWRSLKCYNLGVRKLPGRAWLQARKACLRWPRWKIPRET